ncbi:MAG: dephospho-CoA kinase [Mycoplasmataceae bacterium]|nr:dephospho-CoA kinase [Mycoplasmataceae bacterium]
MKIIITGLTSSGKSTLLDQKWDFNIHRMDQIVKNWYLSDAKLISEIEKEYGRDVMKGRVVSTEALGAIVFKDKAQLGTLNKIVQPFIVKYIKQQISNVDVFEMSAYIGNASVYRKHIDKVVLITREDRDFSDKFEYLSEKIDPLKITDEKFDAEVINNLGIATGKAKLKKLLTEMCN